MKNRTYIYSKITLLLVLILIATVSCERDPTDEAVPATFPSTAEVFIDGFSGGLEYLPFAGSVLDAFSVDEETKFEGSASMRFDVPNVGDPLGSFAGAIFPDNGGRNLSGYDALTFWAKATQAGTINEIGFGQDFGENKFLVTLPNLTLTTNWRKYVIPIPDPSKLTQEKGMFWYAEGPDPILGAGYTFWVDELQYERLGTIAQPRPAILNGNDDTQQTFIGSNITIGGLTQTFNLASGINQTVLAAPSYFEFSSSDPSVATVDELGVVTITGGGTTVVTASLNGVDAAGSLTLESLGDFTPAPTPTRDPANVISIFSDAYTDVPVDFYNGFFAPFQTTQGQNDITINGDNIIKYSELNFVATEFQNPTVNASGMTHFHVDIQIGDPSILPEDFIRIQLGDFGPNGAFGGGDDSNGSVTLTSSDLVSGSWISLDIPLGDFGLSSTNNLAQIFFISDGTADNLPGTITDLLVDNMYFYRDVIDPSPNVDDSAATEVALPIGFESTTLTYDFAGFEGADSAIEANPMPAGINPTGNVMRSTKTNGAQFFAGTFLNLESPIDFSTSQKFRMKILSPKSGIPIRVRLENADNSVGLELDANTTTLNEWEELEWDFSSLDTSASFVRIVVFFEFIPGLAGDGSIYYYDDIQIID